MKKFALAFFLALTAGPVLAGVGAFDLPRLNWPTDDGVTGSTKGCVAVITDETPAPQCG